MNYFLLTVLLMSCLIKTADGQDNKTLSQNKDRNSVISQFFPNLTVETLAGKTVNFPKDTKGKFTVICIAFVQDAQSQADTWTKAILEKYPNKEINYYEIPMLKSGYRFVRRFIDGGMRKGVKITLHNNVATYYGSLEEYKKQLVMLNDDRVYLFLMDAEGKIKYTSESSANAKKLEELFQKIK
jgi:hypothetical protein